MTWLHTLGYRLGQVRQQLGFVKPLAAGEYREVAQQLTVPSAITLFQSMSLADQQHALRVFRGLAARGCTDEDMLTAALLHDVGKAQGRVPFWTRPAIVLGKKLAPRLLSRLTVYPNIQGNIEGKSVGARFIAPQDGGGGEVPKWRRALSYAWYHAEVGADLAAAAGLSERAVLYIRTHHQPNGPAVALHEVDEVS